MSTTETINVGRNYPKKCPSKYHPPTEIAFPLHVYLMDNFSKTLKGIPFRANVFFYSTAFLLFFANLGIRLAFQRTTILT